MDFRHFELLLPRLEGVIDNGGFISHLGAELFKDGESTGSRLFWLQQYRKVDFLTRAVRVDPHSSEMEFFEMDSFLPEPPSQGQGVATPIPSDFQPVLEFQHAAGQKFHSDGLGVHPGPYRWPFEKELIEAREVEAAKVVQLERTRFLRRWKVTQRDADIEMGSG